MLHLKALTVTPWPAPHNTRFPFSLPIIQALRRLTFTTPVTFFVGENGSGKSTLLEAIACASGTVAVGSDSLAADATLAAGRALGAHLRLAWGRRTHRGFFLRAEDFFGYAPKASCNTSNPCQPPPCAIVGVGRCGRISADPPPSPSASPHPAVGSLPRRCGRCPYPAAAAGVPTAPPCAVVGVERRSAR